jgi:hypothetical protein
VLTPVTDRSDVVQHTVREINPEEILASPLSPPLSLALVHRVSWGSCSAQDCIIATSDEGDLGKHLNHLASSMAVNK